MILTVALLLPPGHRHDPFVAALADRSTTILPLTCDASHPSGMAAAAGRIAERGIDLVHSLVGLDGLLTVAGVDVPVLVTIERPLTDDDAPLLALPLETVGLVAATPDLRVGEAPWYGVAAPDVDTVDTYRAFYAKLLSGRENRRPWGFYENLTESHDHKIKRITVAPGMRLSYQQHHRRSEHWVVVRGVAVVTLDGKEHRLTRGQSIDIPQETAHRILNPGDSPLIFAEVQLGDYFGEDDIIRLQDDYGR